MAQKKNSLMAKALAVPFHMQPKTDPEPGTEVRSEKSLKTAPGVMLKHLAIDSETQRENEKLREELKTWDGAMPVRKLDPAEVVPSQWANRHADSFVGADFEALKQEIAASGGNVQPIKVRPIPSGPHAGKFEVVFGHRRHKACLELGISVFALVESVDDRGLFIEMDRENRLRADLRPFEQGEMYRRALSLGLFSSMRKLAEEIGMPVSQVSKAHQIASLPTEVLSAFASPLDIQFRWGSPLAEAIEKRQAQTMKIADELSRARVGGQTLSPQEVFDRLLGTARSPVTPPELIKASNGVSSAKLSRRGGKLLIELDEASLSEKSLEKLKTEISKLLE